MVGASVLDKDAAGFDEAKAGVVAHTVLAQGLYPFKVAGTGAVVVFAAANDLLNLPFCQITVDAHRPDKGGAHDAFVFKGQGMKNGNTLVGAALVFAGDIEKDILPAVAPIRWETLCHSLGAFGEEHEHHIRATAHHRPSLWTPRVGFFEEKVRGHADANVFATLDFEVAGAILLQGIAEAAFGLIDARAVLAAFAVEIIHVAVLAAFAGLDTAVPRVPNIMHVVASFVPIVINL